MIKNRPLIPKRGKNVNPNKELDDYEEEIREAIEKGDDTPIFNDTPKQGAYQIKVMLDEAYNYDEITGLDICSGVLSRKGFGTEKAINSFNEFLNAPKFDNFSKENPPVKIVLVGAPQKINYARLFLNPWIHKVFVKKENANKIILNELVDDLSGGIDNQLDDMKEGIVEKIKKILIDGSKEIPDKIENIHFINTEKYFRTEFDDYQPGGFLVPKSDNFKSLQIALKKYFVAMSERSVMVKIGPQRRLFPEDETAFYRGSIPVEKWNEITRHLFKLKHPLEVLCSWSSNDCIQIYCDHLNVFGAGKNINECMESLEAAIFTLNTSYEGALSETDHAKRVKGNLEILLDFN